MPRSKPADRSSALRNEILTRASQFTPAEVDFLESAIRLGSKEAVHRAIDGSFSPEAAAHLHRAVEQHGAAAVLQGVRQELAADNVARGTADYVQFVQAARSNPAIGAAAEGWIKSAGRDGVVEAMRRYGVSDLGIEVALRQFDATGGDVNRMVANVDHHLATVREAEADRAAHDEALQAVEAAAQKTIADATPGDADAPGVAALKRASSLAAIRRSPEFHDAAAAWLAPRVAHLQQSGLLPASLLEGRMSPADVVLNLFSAAWAEGGPANLMNAHRQPGEKKVEDAEGLKVLADVLGETPENLERSLTIFRDADLKHSLLERRSKSTEETAGQRVKVEPTEVEKAATAREANRREVLQRAIADKTAKAPRSKAVDESGQVVDVPVDAISVADDGPRKAAMAGELARQTGRVVVLDRVGGVRRPGEPVRKPDLEERQRRREAAMSEAYDRTVGAEPEPPAPPEREFRPRDEGRSATERRAALEAAYDAQAGEAQP